MHDKVSNDMIKLATSLPLRTPLQGILIVIASLSSTDADWSFKDRYVALFVCVFLSKMTSMKPNVYLATTCYKLGVNELSNWSFIVYD